MALLNARERECFETLSSVGQKALGSDSSRHCGTTTAATSSNVTAVKVYVVILLVVLKYFFLMLWSVNSYLRPPS